MLEGQRFERGRTDSIVRLSKQCYYQFLRAAGGGENLWVSLKTSLDLCWLWWASLGSLGDVSELSQALFGPRYLYLFGTLRAALSENRFEKNIKATEYKEEQIIKLKKQVRSKLSNNALVRRKNKYVPTVDESLRT